MYKQGPGVELERTCTLIHLMVIEGLGTSGLRIETFRIASPTRSPHDQRCLLEQGRIYQNRIYG